MLPLSLGEHQCFRRRSTRDSPYGHLTTRRLIRRASDLQLVALEQLPSKVQWRFGWISPPCGAVCRGGALLRPKSFRLLSCLSHRGKSPEKPKGFFWSVQGSLRGNRNPLRLFFFCQRFLLEKQKKMLCRSCKFAAAYQPFARLIKNSSPYICRWNVRNKTI